LRYKIFINQLVEKIPCKHGEYFPDQNSYFMNDGDLLVYCGASSCIYDRQTTSGLLWRIGVYRTTTTSSLNRGVSSRNTYIDRRRSLVYRGVSRRFTPTTTHHSTTHSLNRHSELNPLHKFPIFCGAIYSATQCHGSARKNSSG